MNFVMFFSRKMLLRCHLAMPFMGCVLPSIGGTSFFKETEPTVGPKAAIKFLPYPPCFCSIMGSSTTPENFSELQYRCSMLVGELIYNWYKNLQFNWKGFCQKLMGSMSSLTLKGPGSFPVPIYGQYAYG